LLSGPGFDAIPSPAVDDAAQSGRADEDLPAVAVGESRLKDELVEVLLRHDAAAGAEVHDVGLDERLDTTGGAALVCRVLERHAEQRNALDVEPVVDGLGPAQASALVLAGFLVLGVT